MFSIAVVYNCFEGKREEYIKLLEKEGIISDIRNEEGCIMYEYYFSQSNKNEILLIEKWVDKECQKKHVTLPHTQKMLSFKNDYVKSTELKEFTLSDI